MNAIEIKNKFEAAKEEYNEELKKIYQHNYEIVAIEKKRNNLRLIDKGILKVNENEYYDSNNKCLVKVDNHIPDAIKVIPYDSIKDKFIKLKIDLFFYRENYNRDEVNEIRFDKRSYILHGLIKETYDLIDSKTKKELKNYIDKYLGDNMYSSSASKYKGQHEEIGPYTIEIDEIYYKYRYNMLNK